MNASLQNLLALVLFAGLVLSPVRGQEPPAAPAQPAAPAALETPATPDAPEPSAAPAKSKASKGKRRHSETIRKDGSFVHVATDDDGNRVSVGKSAELGAGETAKDFVVVLGDGVVDGTVDGDFVVVLGNATVNGTVKGNAVNVGGGLHLGPKSVIEGDAVGVLGGVAKDQGAQVRGEIVPVPIPGFEGFNSERITRWFGECVLLMRPLSLHVGWVWPIWATFIGFYLLLTVLFPRAVEATANVYAERTASSFLMGVLSVPLVALITLLLSITIIGSPFFIAAVLAGELIGKAALLFQLGRLLGRSMNRTLPPLVAVVAGGLLMTLLYLTPFLGMLVNTVTNFWAVGAATLALSARFRRESPKPSAPFTPPPTPPSGPGGGPGSGPGPKFTPVVPVAPGTPAVSSAALGIVGASALAVSGTGSNTAELNVTTPATPDATASTSTASSGGSPDPSSAVNTPAPEPEPVRSPVAEFLPPRSSFTGSGFSGPGSTAALNNDLALPRAGFGLRLAASLLDWLLFGFIVHSTFLHRFPNFLIWMLAIAAFSGFYIWKGASLGGLVLRLKVIRLDGRRIDLPCALVRSCTTFFSVLCGGIGWLWCVWDKDRQAWHDMLAGTVVVRTEKVQPLL